MKLENVADVYPLTPMQEGMLFHCITEPDSGVYVDIIVVSLKGELDPQRFSQKVQRVLARHEVLRTCFVWDGVDQPLQVVREEVEFEVAQTDWSAHSPTDQRLALEGLIAEQKQTGFDLADAPLVRSRLCRLGSDQWKFVMVFHHLVLDGWSTHLILQQLFSAEPESTSDGHFLFRDYVEWMLQQDHAGAEEFWKRQLEGFDAPNEIGPPCTSTESESKYDQQLLRMDESVSAELREFAKSQRVTLNTVMQAIWSLLVSLYSGGPRDVVFGATVAGRPTELNRIESGVGSFINTIPFRIKLNPENTVGSWLQAIQASHAECRQWEFSSLARAQKQAPISPDATLFESILVFENYPSADEADQSGLVVTGLEHFEQSNFPLAFLIVPGTQIELILIHDLSRIDSRLADRMLEHARHLLKRLTNNHLATVGDLLAELPGQQLGVLNEVNAISVPENEPRMIHEIISDIANQNPEAVAVRFGGDSLTYGELLKESDIVASVLIRNGVKPNEPVGLCLERSPDMVVGILGILKAGGCYVPLDMIYPESHFRHVLADAKIKVVLTTEKCAYRVAAHCEKLVLLDELSEEHSGESRNSHDLSPGELAAYVIYTSGSTGKPKGVQVTHSNLYYSTYARFDYYDCNPDRYLLLSSFAFDSSVAGIFWTLCTGGALVLPPPEAEQKMHELIRLIESEKVTHLLCLPALYKVLLESENGSLESLKVAIVAGEAVTRDVVTTHFEISPQTQLHNEYGPTEGTVWATAHRVQPTDVGVVPIGKPIPSMGVVICDPSGQALPIGSLGEICLFGPGVTSGYLGAGELTKQKFVSRSSYDGQSLSMYRTGDLGCFQEDGSILFAGRVDRQVKVRGYRIELEAIESALNDQASVQEAVVLIHERENAAPQIIAFTTSNGSLNEADLKQELSQSLPGFMVPDRIMFLDELPRLPNGKVDKKSLPLEVETVAANFVAPRNEVESVIASVWSECIGVEKVGVHDNFFSLGGDSIISIQVISRCRRQGVSFEPKDIARHPTVAQLAAVAGTDSLALEPASIEHEFGLAPIQHWFFEQEFEAPHHWNQSQLFELPEDYDRDKLKAAVSATFLAHPMLHASFRRTDEGVWRQQVKIPDEISIEEMQVDSEVAFDESCLHLQSSLELESGPLFKIAIIKTPAVADRVLLVVHHLVIDAVSWQILIDDICFAYRDLVEGKSPVISTKTCSYSTWVARLEQLAEQPLTPDQEGHWSGLAESDTSIPVDVNSSGIDSEGTTSEVVVYLDPDETTRLRQAANEAYHTKPADLLLSALAMTLAEWTERESVLIELESHGREVAGIQEDVSSTVGWFTSTYPVSLSVEKEIGETVKAVKERLRESSVSGASFGIARYLSSQSKLKGGPNPQILFNFLGLKESSQSSGVLRSVVGAEKTSRCPSNQKTHPLEVNAVIDQGELSVQWRYGTERNERATIETLSEQFVNRLKSIISHCCQQEIGFTPSDFPGAGMSQSELDDFLDDFD